MNTLPQHTIIHGNLAFPPSLPDQDTPEFYRPQVVPVVLGHQEILKAQRVMMLQNYRRYVAQYNAEIAKHNAEIAKYNAERFVFIAQNKLENAAKKAQSNFYRKYNQVSTLEFNKCVELANQNSTIALLQKRKLEPVRKNTEHTFALILWKYALQIDEHNKLKLKYNTGCSRPIQRLKINATELSKTKFDDVPALFYCAKTIRNHISRLKSAGILFDYEFHGSQKPISCYISPQILVIYDLSTKKNTFAENQLFSYNYGKNFPNKEIVTSTSVNKEDIIENVNKHSSDKEKIDKQFSSIVTSGEVIQEQLQGHLKRNEASQDKLGGAPEILPKKSESLLKNILTQYDLAHNLQSGTYNKYRFTHRSAFIYEIHSGDLTKEEYRELLLQTFFKMSAALWRDLPEDKRVRVGSWYNAYTFAKESLLLTHNNELPTKKVAFYLFENLIYRLTNAKHFFRKRPEYNILYPSQYFDPYRKTAKSGGFAYTEKFLKDRDKRRERKEKLFDKVQKEAGKRNVNYKAIEFLQQKCKQMVTGKITLEQLYNYAYDNRNIPFKVRQRLPEFIQKAYKC